MAVGDALGTTLEFSEPRAPPFPTLARGPHREILGGGPFRLVAGQVTDDTQMACCLAASLQARGGFDCDDVASRYVAWQEAAFDIGTQTAAALNAIREGRPAQRAGFELWKRAARRPAGNGALMRTAPIAVLLAGAGARRAAALADAAITHFDPRCRLACAAFDAALAAAIEADARPEAMRDAALRELPLAAEALRAEGAGARDVASAARALELDLALAGEPDPRLHGRDVHLHRTQGFVRVAFRLAFWELLHAPSFEEALVDAVNRGGDADTNGAIAGALAGAAHGEAAIPARWREAVLGAVPAAPGPLRDLYHPRTLLAALTPPPPR
ncbi:ADP-ribosylglycohydrolase [Anaeromyxobacter diazotrophicus]|uniref:ADP-ribosylglycohydrolase n=1 Tax=Anaeromyxobacter diazotrophicus TaxID=2590199 RepID=A0A7I9VLL4_9BACT|nr:ADP-ribosylglycohydrolase [Anaeromyxobacter diazotrophicus]